MCRACAYEYKPSWYSPVTHPGFHSVFILKIKKHRLIIRFALIADKRQINFQVTQYSLELVFKNSVNRLKISSTVD